MATPRAPLPVPSPAVACTCASAAPFSKLAKQSSSLRSRCTSSLVQLRFGAPVAVAVANGGLVQSPASSAPCSVADSAESLSRSNSGISSPSDSDTESNRGRRLSTSSTCSASSAGGSTCARHFRAAGPVACSAAAAAAAAPAAALAMTPSALTTCSDFSTTPITTATATTTTASIGTACSSASSSTVPSPRPPLRSSLRRPKAARARAGCGSPAPRKTVTFSAGGDTICTPPTAEALGLLAAGARAAPVVPTATSSACSIPTATAEPSIAAAPARSLSAELPADPSTAPAAAAAAAAAPAPASSWAPLPLPLSPAPSAAFSTPGRQRVQQALAEAKARHGHLGRQPLPAAWPLPPHAPGYEAALRAEEAARQLLLQAREPQVPGRWERLAGSPNLPLSHQDSGLLSLAYAAPSEAQQVDAGRSAGGVAAAAALREMLASEPLLLARVVARQQALSPALAGAAAAL